MRRAVSALFAIILPFGAALAADPPVGERFAVDPATLPPVGATPPATAPAQQVPRPNDLTLAVPDGFQATLVMYDLNGPRNLLALPDGSVLIALSGKGIILRYHEGRTSTFANGFDTPYGLAYHDGAVWVADTEAVWRIDGTGSKVRMTPPGALGEPIGHVTRSLAIAPDGRHFYVGIGSAHNLAEEAPPRATVQEFAINGSGQRTYASGLRNPVGLMMRPGSNELWTVVNERDEQGDEMVPDYLVHLRDGAFYGWPYAYLGANPQPGWAEKAPDKVKTTLAPDLFIRAHSAPLGLTFWHGDAFVALHGSWNRSRPQGYFVARIPFTGDHPSGGYDVFASGFKLGEAHGRAQVWGRPVGLTVGTDDALYICDDVGGTLWRISRTSAPHGH